MRWLFPEIIITRGSDSNRVRSSLQKRWNVSDGTQSSSRMTPRSSDSKNHEIALGTKHSHPSFWSLKSVC